MRGRKGPTARMDDETRKGYLRMGNDIDTVIRRIAAEHRDAILPSSNVYREVDIGEQAARLGLSELKGRYKDVFAIVPLKEASKGMKVLIDGRTFVNYAQYDSGVVVPGYVARESALPFRPYVPDESMVLDFA